MIGDLAEVFPSVGAALGAPGLQNRLDLPTARNAVVVVVDGLGHDLLAEHAEHAPFLAGLQRRPALECGVPSTTATSLTTLGTALPPGRHGVVGYTSRIPGTGRRLNALHWDEEVDPLLWQPHPTVLERLAAAGLDARVVNDAKFAGSGLTRCGQRGVPYHPVGSTWERLEAVLQIVEAPGNSVVYAYESSLDHEGHKSGCTSEAWRTVLSAIDADLATLAAELPVGTMLVVTADHGMVDLPRDGRFDLDAVPALRDDVVLVAGEARLRHLYTLQGAADQVAQTWRAELGERAEVLTRAEAEAAGWFGEVDAAVRPRIGDVLVAAQGDFAVFSTVDFGVEMLMTGFHGSTSPAERRIPLLVDVV